VRERGKTRSGSKEGAERKATANEFGPVVVVGRAVETGSFAEEDKETRKLLGAMRGERWKGAAQKSVVRSEAAPVIDE
jgi:hypothetical protein